ncbi:DJ-1/PfpI family protein, partial [Oceanospirillum multiglobuliferum]
LGVLLFEGFELLDVFGPLEMFGQIDDLNIDMVAEETGAIMSAQGPAAMAQELLSNKTDYDIILVPGGIGTRKEVDNIEVINWISSQASKAKYIASVCTGSALLARAGVLDGKKATTNKFAFS